MVINHRNVSVNDITMHIAEQGTGPLVLLLHGFPESWYSWRHQLQPLADAGFHVVAPDQRGYAGTDQPEDVNQYTMLHLVGDIIGLIHALGEREAVVVGHDFGAVVAWHTALLRPDVIRGVVGLSVPPPLRTPEPPLGLAEKKFGKDFYQLYFQRPGVADAEFAVDIKDTILRFFFAASGDVATAGPGSKYFPQDPAETEAAPAALAAPGTYSFLNTMPKPLVLPPWLTEADMDAFAEQYARNKFTGGLNWYRNMDRNWELTAPWAGAMITAPALYVTGTYDGVRTFGDQYAIERVPEMLTDLRGLLDFQDCGHWTQQERPDETNKALVEFLTGLR